MKYYDRSQSLYDLMEARVAINCTLDQEALAAS